MAPNQSVPDAKTKNHPKLKRLPEHARIQKRPLLRPPIPSPYTNASQPKVIYVSSKTPFISVVKRVRKLLLLIDKRAMGKVELVNSKGNEKQRLQALTKQDSEPEEVLLKASGKAVEKVLGLGLYFQGQDDCRIRLRTTSVGAVDDIVERDEPIMAKKRRAKSGQGVDARELEEGKGLEVKMSGEGDEEDEDEELPETQVRRLSVVEVRISLR